MKNPIIIVQGAQYGSEAKGQIAGVICEREEVDIAVRTGATNAGHTVYHDGKPIKFQQLPVAAIFPNIQLVLGAGALINPEILERECKLVDELVGGTIKGRLVIDHRAGIHLPLIHAKRSAESGRHHEIGATGEGASEALMDRIRGRGFKENFGESQWGSDYDLADTAEFLNDMHNEGKKILLEGTQGTLLDLYLGPYPYVTHKQTGPAQWMMEAGLSPALPTDIVSVVRTYPIRVAGNSGPLPLETSWPLLARVINQKRHKLKLPPIVLDDDILRFEMAVRVASSKMYKPVHSDGLDQHEWTAAERKEFKVALSEVHKEALLLLQPDQRDRLAKLFEFTTVTKKLRRVANLSPADLEYSSKMVRPHRVAITFMNYQFPEWWYEIPHSYDLHHIEKYVKLIEVGTAAKVRYLGWGPESAHVEER